MNPASSEVQLGAGVLLPSAGAVAARLIRFRVGASEADIYLYGSIGEFGISAGAFVRELRSLDAGVSTLHVRVNSPGGSLDDARAIATALFEWSGRVVMHVDGVAASAAAFLLLAGDEILMADGSFLMIHKPWTFTLGDDEDHDGTAELLRKYEAVIVDSYVRRTGLPAATIRDWMNEESWFTAEEAVTAGLADRIVPSVPEHGEVAAMVAGLAIDFSGFRRVPAALVRMFQNRKVKSMSLQNPAVASATNQATPPADGRAVAVSPPPPPPVDAVMAERQRGINIRSVGEFCGIDPAVTDRAIQNGMDVENFRRFAFEQRAANDPANFIRVGHISATAGADEVDRTREAFSTALYAKLFAPSTPNVDERFRGQRLIEMVGNFHRAMGYSGIGRDPSELAAQALGMKHLSGGRALGAMQVTSDFPWILANTLNKRLLDLYLASPAALKAIARERTAPDFRKLTAVRLGEFPSLELVPEGTDIQQGTIADYGGGYTIGAYGRIVMVSRQALVNDDLGAFNQLATAGAQGAVDREAKLLVAVLTANSGAGQTLDADSKAIFHVDHANLAAAGGPIDDTTLGAARLAMRLQTGVGGVDIIDATPKFLVVPAALETTAQKYLASLTPAAASDVNPFAGTLQLVVEPRLDAASAVRWYLAAEPLRTACLEIAYLEGSNRPRIETDVDFKSEAFSMKTVLDVGAGAVDFRGMYMNPGVTTP